MKKLSVSLIALLTIFGFAVTANAGYLGNSNQAHRRGQRYQVRETTFTIPPIKIGVGFNRQISVVAGAYGLTPDDLSLRLYAGDFGGEFDIGGNQFADGRSDSDTFNLQLKVFYTIVSKKFVKFNAGLAGFYSTYSFPLKKVGYDDQAYIIIGTGIDVIAGPEFFIPQLPELGFNVEIGFGYHSYSYNNNHFAGDDFGTRGFDFLQAGIHYYFN